MGELANHNVRLGSSLLDHGSIVEVAVHELGVGVLVLNDLGSVLIADEQSVLAVWVCLLDSEENIATDVAWKAARDVSGTRLPLRREGLTGGSKPARSLSVFIVFCFGPDKTRGGTTAMATHRKILVGIFEVLSCGVVLRSVEVFVISSFNR